MVTLRHFDSKDAETIRSVLYPDMTANEAADMIEEWNACVYRGHYFEMFAVLCSNKLVGHASLYELSRSVISVGVEICSAERGKGFASEALSRLFEYAAEREYRLVFDQVRTDNPASIKMHNDLGFESDGYVYRNQRDHEIFIFIKFL